MSGIALKRMSYLFPWVTFTAPTLFVFRLSLPEVFLRSFLSFKLLHTFAKSTTRCSIAPKKGITFISFTPLSMPILRLSQPRLLKIFRSIGASNCMHSFLLSNAFFCSSTFFCVCKTRSRTLSICTTRPFFRPRSCATAMRSPGEYFYFQFHTLQCPYSIRLIVLRHENFVYHNHYCIY